MNSINSIQKNQNINIPDSHILLEIQHSYRMSLAAQDHCNIYYLLHWDGEFIKEKLGSSDNIIQRDGITFAINWGSEAKKRAILDSKRVAMSFRRIVGTQLGIIIPKIIYGGAVLDRRVYSC